MRTGLTIDEFYAKPEGAQKFILASMHFELDREEKARKNRERANKNRGRW